MVLEGSPRDRYERNHKGVNPQLNQLFAAGDQGLGAIAESGQQVGGDLAATKNQHSLLEGPVVVVEGDLGFARQNPAPYLWLDHLQMHAKAVDTGLLHARVPDRIFRWFALRLDGNIHQLFHSHGGFRHQSRTPVIAVRGAGCHHELLDAIQPNGGFCDLRDLLWCLADNRAGILKGLLDGAELAGVGSIAEANAGLKQGGGQYISPVQERDGSIGGAVGRGEAVEGGFACDSDGTQRLTGTAGECDAALWIGLQAVGGCLRCRVVNGHHHGGAIDSDSPVIGWTGASTPAFVARE